MSAPLLRIFVTGLDHPLLGRWSDRGLEVVTDDGRVLPVEDGEIVLDDGRLYRVEGVETQPIIVAPPAGAVAVFEDAEGRKYEFPIFATRVDLIGSGDVLLYSADGFDWASTRENHSFRYLGPRLVKP